MDELIGPLQKDAILGTITAWVEQVAQDLTKMVNKPVSISGGSWNTIPTQSLKEQYPFAKLLIGLEIENSEPFYVVLEAKLAGVIVDLFMGGDGSAATQEFSDIQQGILDEMASQMGTSLSTSLSDTTGKKFKCLSQKVQLESPGVLPPQVVLMSYQLSVADSWKGSFMVLMGMQHAVDLATSLASVKSKVPAAVGGGTSPREEREVSAKPAQFSQLSSQAPGQTVGNLDLILDVLLQLTAVLGRTGISIKDLVQLGPGSVLELDRLAGEPVELYANNKLVAKGEVVVIDEKFAVRVTETVSPAERLQGLKS